MIVFVVETKHLKRIYGVVLSLGTLINVSMFCNLQSVKLLSGFR